MLCFLRLTDYYCLTAGRLNLLFGRAGEVVRRNCQRTTHLARAENLEASLQLLDYA